MKFDPQIHHRRSIRLKGYDYTSSGAYFVTLCAWQRDCIFGEVVEGEVRLSNLGHIVKFEWLRSISIRREIRLHKDEFVVMPNHIHGIVWIIDPVGAYGIRPVGTHPNSIHIEQGPSLVPLQADQQMGDANVVGADGIRPDGIHAEQGARREPLQAYQQMVGANDVGADGIRPDGIHPDGTHPNDVRTEQGARREPLQTDQQMGGANDVGADGIRPDGIRPDAIRPDDIHAEQCAHLSHLQRAPRSLSSFIAGFKASVTSRAKRELKMSGIWQRNFYDHIVRDEQDLHNIWNYIKSNPLKWEQDQLHPAAAPNQFNQEK